MCVCSKAEIDWLVGLGFKRKFATKFDAQLAGEGHFSRKTEIFCTLFVLWCGGGGGESDGGPRAF